MLNERVALGEPGTAQVKTRACDIIIPDIRFLAVFLDSPETSLLIWAHRVAQGTLDKILRRRRWNYVREVFELDVPDLEDIARRFPKEERTLLLNFWATYHAVVRHFLPKARPQVYYYNNVRGGVRFHGWSWFTPDPEK